MSELRSANEYDDRGVQAVYAVLLEIGQVLGAYRDRFVVIGGSVPWLLLPDAQPAHIGTLDVDLSLDADALGDGEYAHLVEALEAAGYERAADGMRVFQLRRQVDLDGLGPVSVIIDLLMPREARIERNKPAMLANFAVQKADGAALAMQSNVLHQLDGTMPDGRLNTVALRVASIPAFLVMKGYAAAGRDKHKDCYDIYFSVRNAPGGPLALAQECRSVLNNPIALTGYQHIRQKFSKEDGFGPVTVRRFLEDSQALGDMTPEQVQVDAYRQVAAWLDALGL
jgi:hypothetical protein